MLPKRSDSSKSLTKAINKEEIFENEELKQ